MHRMLQGVVMQVGEFPTNAQVTRVSEFVLPTFGTNGTDGRLVCVLKTFDTISENWISCFMLRKGQRQNSLLLATSIRLSYQTSFFYYLTLPFVFLLFFWS